MFVGTFKLAIDGSRIFLPKEIFSEVDPRNLILFCDEKKRQVVFYRKDSMESLIQTFPLNPDRISERLSKMLAKGHKSKVDSKRRLLIPNHHKKSVKLTQNCYLIGQGHFCVLKAKPYL